MEIIDQIRMQLATTSGGAATAITLSHAGSESIAHQISLNYTIYPTPQMNEQTIFGMRVVIDPDLGPDEWKLVQG